MRFVVTALAMIFLGGCATASLNIEESFAITEMKISKIHKNVTTRDELRSMFGEPEIKNPLPEGATYFYKDISLHSLWIRFNDDWTVSDFEYSQ